MAKVNAPLLSLGARGKFGNTLVASAWKGLNTMRQYVVPANPQSADQTTQRNAFTAAVSAWRNYLTNALMRSAWDRSALASGNPQSGFNAGIRALVKILVDNADASFAQAAAAGAAYVAAFTMKNMDDGATGDEAGNFEVWVGDSPTSLLLNGTAAIAVGVVTTAALGSAPAVKYIKLRKDAEDRSGIVKITIAA